MKSTEDINENNLFYSSLLKKYGTNHRSLNWGSEESQHRRFEALASVGIKNYDKVLDVGCGLADFYSWSRSKNINVIYSGIDISPEMVKKSKDRFPKLLIENKDIFELNKPYDFYDYAIASGIFYLRKTDPYEYMIKTIQEMFKISKIATAFNTLSEWCLDKQENEFYADPLKLLNEIKSKITKKVIFRHDYNINDFSVFLYK